MKFSKTQFYKYYKNIISFLFLLFLVLYLFNCCNKEPGYSDLPVLEFDSVYVGLYIDDAVWSGLKESSKNIIRALKFSYKIINADSIKYGNLENYSVLFFSAGRPDLYAEELGSKGMENIRKYVSRGGGYVGICGTAYLASKKSIWHGWSGEPRVYYEDEYDIQVFKGNADGPVEDFAPSYKSTNCKIIINKNHSLSNNLSDTIAYYYDHGLEFAISNENDADVLGTTVKGHNLFIITTEFNNGRIFLSSGHPEVTNSEDCRQLINNAIVWCSKQ